MKQHPQPVRHFLTAVMVLMAGLGAQGVRADTLTDPSPGVNDAPLSALDLDPIITPTNTLYITQPVSDNQTLVRDNDASAFGGAVSVVNPGTMVISNAGGIHFGASDISGHLAITAAGNIQDSGQLVVAGWSSFEAGNSTIPEPGTWALMGLGLVGITASARRRRA